MEHVDSLNRNLNSLIRWIKITNNPTTVLDIKAENEFCLSLSDKTNNHVTKNKGADVIKTYHYEFLHIGCEVCTCARNYTSLGDGLEKKCSEF